MQLPKLGIVLLDIVLGLCIILHGFRIFVLCVVVDHTRSQPFYRSVYLILWVTISELAVARLQLCVRVMIFPDLHSVSARRRPQSRLQYLQLLLLDRCGYSFCAFPSSILSIGVDVSLWVCGYNSPPRSVLLDFHRSLFA